MKKFISLAMCLFLVLSGTLVAYAENAAEPKKLSIVSTIFPPYDFVRTIAGGHVELTMLLPPGSESHSFEPTPKDIITIQNCDIFLYIGGETDSWVNRILESMDTSSFTVMPLIGMVDTVQEEIVEGMEHDHDHAHDEGEFDPDAVHDRAVTDWGRSWAPIAPLAADGSLDNYLASLAEEQGTTLEAFRTAQTDKWQADFDALTVVGDTLSIEKNGTTTEAAYTYEGYAILQGEDHASVWYQYQIAQPQDGMPAYVMFNDHGTGGADGDHDHEEHGHEEGLAHTHMRYGDDGFLPLLEDENWSPFLVEASGSADDVIATLSGHGHSHSEAEHAELDEHVWTSPRNAKRIVNTIAEKLAELDPMHADTYYTNATAYGQELEQLDEAFSDVVKNASRTTVLFGDRFPFRYLADAYGLSYYAAFPGCASETEASAATVAFLIDKAKEEAVPVVFTMEFSNGKIADVISESTGAKRLEMHSCHNVSKKDFEAGTTYLDLMWRNVDQLKEALQ